MALRPTFETLHLNRVPEGHVSKRKVVSVNYARQAPKEKDIKWREPIQYNIVVINHIPNLVLVVFQKSFQSNSNDFDHVLHGVARCVQKSDGEEVLVEEDIEMIIWAVDQGEAWKTSEYGISPSDQTNLVVAAQTWSQIVPLGDSLLKCCGGTSD